MAYPTRRSLIAAEKKAQRSRRRQSFSLGLAGIATVASASVAGLAPANASMEDNAAVGPTANTTTSSTTAGSTSSGTYTVKSGDTLARIAANHDVSLSTLMNANGLSASSTIYPGETLKLSEGSSSPSSNATSDSSTNRTSSAATQAAAAGSDIQTASTASAATASGWQAGAAQKAVEIVDSGAVYQYGANGPNAYDCSAFTQTAFASGGKQLPRTTDQQFADASQYVSLSNLQVGDLVFWSNNGAASGIYHVAMYIGDGKIAQARNPEAGISVNDLDYYMQWNPPMDTAARY